MAAAGDAVGTLEELLQRLQPSRRRMRPVLEDAIERATQDLRLGDPESLGLALERTLLSLVDVELLADHGTCIT